jgi:hypothetical protein
MQNNQWKIIGHRLQTKCPIELKDNSVALLLSTINIGVHGIWGPTNEMKALKMENYSKKQSPGGHQFI